MMDRETIIKLANETLDRMAPDDYCRAPYWTATDDELEHFAKLVAEHEQPALDEYKAAYIEAMVASNEAGFAGMTAAETIRELNRMVSEQPAPAQEPVAWLYQCSADSSGPVLTQHKKDWAESGSGLWTEAALYTTPPAPAQDDRNKLAAWMMEFAFATGHGDTMEDLLDALGTEIVDTIDAARDDEREACARLCEAEGLLWGQRYAASIRARGKE